MTQPIRSKLHRAIELAVADEVYMVATNKPVIGVNGIDTGKAKHWSEYGAQEARIIEALTLHMTDPTFVISDTVQALTNGRMNDFQKSMLDLKEAGLLRLPFEIMNLEFGYTTDLGNKAHAIVHMMDLQADATDSTFRQTLAEELATRINRQSEHNVASFKALLDDASYDILLEVFRIEKDKDGEYLVISPSYTFLGVTRGADGTPWIKSSSRPFAYYTNIDAVDVVAESAYKKDTHLGLYAFIYATLVYNTQGIEREKVECGKLNKKRKASGKTLIANHHYIYLDRVYRSSAAEDNSSERYDERKHPRPHWRKAHVRGVRYGVGRVNTKQMAIPARIVAWNGKGPEPAKPTGATVVKMRGKKK